MLGECCFGPPLAYDVKAIAILQIVINSISLANQLYEQTHQEKVDKETDFESFLSVVLCLNYAITVLGIIFALVLFEGARKRQPGKCFAWIAFNSIVLIMQVLLVILLAVALSGDAIIEGLKAVLWFLLIFCVHRFMNEIKEEALVGGNNRDVQNGRT